MPEKRTAILQSNYIPWKGYFDIINHVDHFIILDEVQYTKNDWRNRNRIKTSQGLQWLTIPVFHQLSQRIDETRTTDQSWRLKHWTALSQSYSKAPYFKTCRDKVRETYLGSTETLLSKINFSFITLITELLEIPTQISWSTELGTIPGKTQRLVDLCQKTGAQEYLSGPAAKGYLDESLFKEAGISVRWMDYSGYPEYSQLHPPFEHAVSIFDLIFNQGPHAANYMKSFKRP
jgi:WbqC-like protein family